MMTHPLDRPIWSLLNGPQASLAVASGAVCRIDPTYGPFAAAAPGHEPELAGLLKQLWEAGYEVLDTATRQADAASLRHFFDHEGSTP